MAKALKEYRLRAIPIDLWREVSLYCAKHSITKRELILRLLAKQVGYRRGKE